MNASTLLRSEQPLRPKSMTPKVLSYQSGKGRALAARPLQIKPVEKWMSLIETFSCQRPSSLGSPGPCRHSQATQYDVRPRPRSMTSLTIGYIDATARLQLAATRVTEADPKAAC